MTLQRFPGLIDVHVHLREPGGEHKEDFRTGSRAAAKGGFSYVLDMPNTPVTTTTIARLKEKVKLADAKSLCDIGFHYGTDGKNMKSFAAAAAHPRVFGLKIYCNHTTGEMLIQNRQVLEQIFKAWESDKPVLVHAEGEQLAMALELARQFKRRLHVCHISQASEVDMVRDAKSSGQPVTAGACPHHLFLTKADVPKLGGFAIMKPPLGTADDQAGLWAGLADNTIDLIETDHAPHTRAEKEANPPAFGVPGLETAVGLTCLAIKQGRLQPDDLQRLLYDNPMRIFGVPDQPDTYIELDPDEPYTIGADGYETKCGWSPFDGWKVYGKVQTVVLRKKAVVKKGKIVI